MPNSGDDRRRNAYQLATTLSATELAETFLGCENQIEVVGTLTKDANATTYTLRFADRPKYVGDNFYEGRAQFQPTKKTIGELQAPTIQFSTFQVTLNNVDGFYNHYLPNGTDYFSFIGARLVIQLGLRDVSGSFFTIFDGYIQDQGGFSIERQSIILNATDRFDVLNTKTNLPAINVTDFPSAPTDSLGKIIPLVLGDWEAGFDVNDGYSTLTITGAVDVIELAAPGTNFYGGIIGYNVGGGFFLFAVGTFLPDNISRCYIKRGNDLLRTNFTAAPATGAGYYEVDVTSLYVPGGGGVSYTYQSGDMAIISVKVPYDSAPKYSNIIEIAETILTNFTGFSSGDLDATSWNALAAKSSPASCDMTSIKARLWLGENNSTWMQVIRGLLEQVRVEIYVNSSAKIALRALHPDEFVAQASLDRIEQVEIDEKSLEIKADDTTYMNQAQINYAFTPVTNKTARVTQQRKNAISITGSGKTVIKGIDCPALYQSTDAVNQLDEFIRFYSTGLFYIQLQVAWVHLLKDLGNFVGLNYSIGSIDFSNAPMIIRDYGIDVTTGSVILRLLSLANFSYTGYAPSNSANFLSGAAATIIDA